MSNCASIVKIFFFLVFFIFFSWEELIYIFEYVCVCVCVYIYIWYVFSLLYINVKKVEEDDCYVLPWKEKHLLYSSWKSIGCVDWRFMDGNVFIKFIHDVAEQSLFTFLSPVP